MVPPRAILAELPPKLWIKIHRLATYVPDLLNPDFAQDFSSPLRRTLWKLLRESLVTKRYLVRVCKQWRSLASPFLYESIYIGRGRALSSLSSTLALSKENPARHGVDRALGSWTKRIDVVMRDHIGLRGPDRDVGAELALLAQIFLLLPSLTIIDFGITASLYDGAHLRGVVLRSIARTSGRGLEAVVWHIDTAAPVEADWQAFLAAAPNLRTVQCRTSIFADAPAHPDSASPLRVLHNVAINSDNGPSPPLEQLPALPLRRVYIDSTIDEGLRPQTTLLEKYGAGLRVIQLGGQVLSELPPNLRLLSRTCPGLSRLELCLCNAIDSEADWSDLPATVETLGLQFDRRRLSGRVYETVFDGLLRIPPGSKLKAIWFTDPLMVKDLKERHPQVLAKNAGRLAKMGWEVCDHEGRLMHGPPSELRARGLGG